MHALLRSAGSSALVAATLLALGCAMGAVLVGHAVLVPAVRAADLVDPNLARAVSGPLALRASELLLAACVVLTMTTPRSWVAAGVSHSPFAQKLVSTLALAATALAAVDRVVVLPRSLHAWAQVDIVAGRPQRAFEAAERLGHIHAGILIAAVACLVVGSFAAAHAITKRGVE